MSVLTVTLNPSLDQIHFVRNLQVGKDQNVIKTIFSSGGKGINVSRALQNLGVKNIPMGFAGGNNGQKLLRELIVERMEPDFVFIDGETRANITVIDEVRKKTTRFLEPGPWIAARDLKSFRRKYERLLEECEWVVLSGSGIIGTPANFYSELIKVAQGKGKKIAFDSSKKDLINGLKAKPYLLKLNREEAESVCGAKLSSARTLKKGLKKLLKKGVKQAIITLGAAGAAGSDGQGFWQSSGPKVKTRNVVGCGDSFLAGFLFAELQQKSFPECLAAGVAAGSVSSQNVVPGRVDKTKFIALCGKIHAVSLKEK